MTRSTLSRLVVSSTLVLAAAAMLSPLSGCQSGGLGGLMGSKSAMDMLSPMVKDAANSYVGNLTSLTSSLNNLHDLQGVMDFVRKVEPTVKELSSSYNTLSATKGEDRTNLMTAFGPKINAANSGFLDKANTAKSNPLWNQALSGTLDRVKLFQ